MALLSCYPGGYVPSCCYPGGYVLLLLLPGWYVLLLLYYPGGVGPTSCCPGGCSGADFLQPGLITGMCSGAGMLGEEKGCVVGPACWWEEGALPHCIRGTPAAVQTIPERVIPGLLATPACSRTSRRGARWTSSRLLPDDGLLGSRLGFTLGGCPLSSRIVTVLFTFVSLDQLRFPDHVQDLIQRSDAARATRPSTA